MGFDKWKQRLAIVQAHPTIKAQHEAVAALKINFMVPDHEDEGYYRKPVTEKVAGKTVIKDWIPVAYWVEDGALIGTIGNREMTEEEIADAELWSWVVSNPIPYQLFVDVTDGKPWPDMRRLLTENQPPADDSVKAPETAEEHRAAIKMIVDTVKADFEIGSEEDAAIWLGTKNTLAALRLAADKAGKAVYQPHYAAYKKAFDEWTPMVKASEQAEKRIDTAYKLFQNERRKKAEEAAAAAERARREEEERHARAADRAIAAGRPPADEEPPEIEEIEPPPPAPTPIAPTVGTRTPKLELQTFLDQITDESAVCAFFRGDPDLVATLKTLIGRAIKRGQTVPGITTREGYI